MTKKVARREDCMCGLVHPRNLCGPRQWFRSVGIERDNQESLLMTADGGYKLMNA